MWRRDLMLASLVAACAALAPGGAHAQPGVDVDSAVRPILAEDAIRPIDLRASVLPLENVQTRGKRTRVTLSADVLFAFDSATLTRAARRTIGRVARRLDDAHGVVRVDGYTDSLGAEAYNRRLSQRRARAVVAVLRQSTGSATRFSARGHGESDPVAPNTSAGKDNPSGRAENRRVTISYQRR